MTKTKHIAVLSRIARAALLDLNKAKAKSEHLAEARALGRFQAVEEMAAQAGVALSFGSVLATIFMGGDIDAVLNEVVGKAEAAEQAEQAKITAAVKAGFDTKRTREAAEAKGGKTK